MKVKKEKKGKKERRKEKKRKEKRKQKRRKSTNFSNIEQKQQNNLLIAIGNQQHLSLAIINFKLFSI